MFVHINVDNNINVLFDDAQFGKKKKLSTRRRSATILLMSRTLRHSLETPKAVMEKP